MIHEVWVCTILSVSVPLSFFSATHRFVREVHILNCKLYLFFVSARHFF